MKQVAITGMGIVSSLGLSVEEFFQGLMAGRVAVAESPWVGEDGIEYGWTSAVESFCPEDWMDERVVAGTDRFAQFAIAAAVQAVESSGLQKLDPLRTAVVVGTSMAGVESIARSQHGLDTIGRNGVDRKLQLQAWPNMAAGQIALRYQLHGPLLTVSTACASSLDAIGIAARMIETGQADVAISGGCDSGKTKLTSIAGSLYGMAKSQPDPYKACRPFDANRTGVMGGEGAGIVILERADLAEERGAAVHGLMRGYGSLSDAYHPSSPDPSGQWEKRAMEMAIEEAGLPGGAGDVDAVVAHGTGTPVGDTAEIRAINELFAGREEPQGLDLGAAPEQHGVPHEPVVEQQLDRVAVDLGVEPDVAAVHVEGDAHDAVGGQDAVAPGGRGRWRARVCGQPRHGRDQQREGRRESRRSAPAGPAVDRCVSSVSGVLHGLSYPLAIPRLNRSRKWLTYSSASKLAKE